MKSLREVWDAQAEQWIRFARTPGHDHAGEQLNIPAFLQLLPPAPRRVLDVGCGEGRLGALLAERGYEVLGIDASPRLVEAARERHEAVVADAAALPFAEAEFDLVTLFMSLHDFDEPAAAVREGARVLRPGGHLCAALEHPFSAVGAFPSRDADAAFVVEGSYLDVQRLAFEHRRDGIEVTLAKQTGPLEWYGRMLEEAGLLVEALREPVPDDAYVRSHPAAARRRRIPAFLHVRALKP
ncbi:MAG TPA: class I SAM-dependent methyltransferase [Gaiellaceae bacterium]|nr:class I SAM-dependent methyltransferase [Gaiellaceae bacterium]